MEETDRQKTIEAMAELFRQQGRIVPRREYMRLQKEAWDLALSQTLNQECPLPKESIETESEEFKKIARMVGLQRKTLPRKQKEQLAEMVATVESSLQTFLPKFKPVQLSSSGKEAACLLLSDLHAGKLVIDDQNSLIYSRDIFVQRMEVLAERVVRLLTYHLRRDTIDEVYVLLAGDLVDGSGIYDNQSLHQDLTNFLPQVSLAAASIWNVIKRLREHGFPVHIRGVRGNHGRQGQYAPSDNNFDYLVMQALAFMAHYEDPTGVDILYSPVEYLNFDVKGHRIHMRHEAPPQAETAAAKAKFGGWKHIHDYDVLCYGHMHHPTNGSYLGYPVFMNGCPIGIDDLAERMATRSRPTQTLFGIDPKWGVSFHYNVYLDREGDAKGNEYEGLMRGAPGVLHKSL